MHWHTHFSFCLQHQTLWCVMMSITSSLYFTLHMISLSMSHEEASLVLKSKIIGLFLAIALWCIDQPLSDFLSVQKLCKQYLQCVFTPLESLHYFIENVVSMKCSQMKFCLLLPLDKTPVWGLVTVTSGGGYAHFNIPVWCRYWDSLFKFYSGNTTFIPVVCNNRATMRSRFFWTTRSKILSTRFPHMEGLIEGNKEQLKALRMCASISHNHRQCH
jgi:hypothetical protein